MTNCFSVVEASSTESAVRRTVGSRAVRAWFAVVVVMVAGAALSGYVGHHSSSTQKAIAASSSLPSGYAEFCGRHPDLCQLPEGPKGRSVQKNS